MKELINSRAWIEAKDIIGRTPLIMALANKHTDVVKYLLFKKANPWTQVADLDLKKFLKGMYEGYTME